MLKALEAAKSKLSHYYAMTDNMPGDLYATGTIIAPQNKLKIFPTKEWEDLDQDWLTRYRKSLEDYLESYKKVLFDIQSLSKADESAIALSELEVSCMPEDSQSSLSGQRDELTQYVESGVCYPGLENTISNFGSRHCSLPFTNLLEGSSTRLSRTGEACPGCPLNPCNWCWCRAAFQLCPRHLLLWPRLPEPPNISRSHDVHVYIKI